MFNPFFKNHGPIKISEIIKLLNININNQHKDKEIQGYKKGKTPPPIIVRKEPQENEGKYDFAHFFSNTKEEPIIFPIKKNKNPAAFEARDLAQKKRIARMKKKIKEEMLQ